jgi:hypothetical protein
LSNVANLGEFSDGIKHYTRQDFKLSDAQMSNLVTNGFVVVPSDAEQFFHIYESHHYGMKPRVNNFITSDCLLQLYHMFYSLTLRAIETRDLLPALEELTRGMLEGSLEQMDEIDDPMLQDACLKNLAFFGVAAKLLGLEDYPLPLDCDGWVETELARIEAAQGRERSTIFPHSHDYTQYIPRGHYTRSPELETFFKTMMWFGTNSFPVKSGTTTTEQQVMQALLITHLLFEGDEYYRPLLEKWDSVYLVTTLYVGESDDLTPHDFKPVMDEVYGEVANLDDYIDGFKLVQFSQKAATLREPKIKVQAVGIPSGKQFRFMGQRFIPDSYMMQNLVKWPERPWPKGLDVMAVLGSGRAAILLDSLYREPELWSGYIPNREMLQEEFGGLDEDKWFSNLYYGWLYALNALLEPPELTSPPFMHNTAWTDKELNAALASWAEMRHDVILYAKQSMAEGGNGQEKETQVKGYVEPVPEFYRRLENLVMMNNEVMRRAHINSYHTTRLKTLFDDFTNQLQFFHLVALMELRGDNLNYSQHERIRNFGAWLEDISLRIVEFGQGEGELRGWYEVTGPDRDVACIADVHTSEVNCLEEAVGHVNTIYVIVPIEGQWHITRGSVFTYYEFTYPSDHRLDDEAWQEMLKRKAAPQPPVWTSSFIVE